MKADYVSIIEAAYRIDLDEVSWLRALAEAASATLDAGLGIVVYTVDASDPAHFRRGNVVAAGPLESLDCAGMLAKTPELGQRRIRKLYVPSPPALLLSECLGRPRSHRKRLQRPSATTCSHTVSPTCLRSAASTRAARAASCARRFRIRAGLRPVGVES